MNNVILRSGITNINGIKISFKFKVFLQQILLHIPPMENTMGPSPAEIDRRNPAVRIHACTVRAVSEKAHIQ